MPIMDGLTPLKKIKANTATASIPVIMVTSESEKTRIIEKRLVQFDSIHYKLWKLSIEQTRSGGSKQVMLYSNIIWLGLGLGVRLVY